jgi:NAD(P)-dependent dehydrogenase (short-subunit alcohol dehydrogenase family)
VSSSPRFTTPFNGHTTADEVIKDVDLSGRRALITGASSGLGAETARALASAGAEVTLAVRNPDAGRRAAEDVTGKTGNANVHVAALDLLDRASIDAFVAAWSGPLHVLVNNAGVMAIPTLQLSPEGWEMQFATNHLGHFALTVGLHDALATGDGARVVSVSSAAHLRAGVDFDDINFERRPYDPWTAYGQSKTANILFAVGAAARWAGDGIVVNAIHPGAIYDTGLLRHVEITPEFQQTVDATPWKTVEQGAATQVLAAASPRLDGVTGRFLGDCNEAVVADEGWAEDLVRPYALDKANADRLWDLSVATLRPQER